MGLKLYYQPLGTITKCDYTHT